MDDIDRLLDELQEFRYEEAQRDDDGHGWLCNFSPFLASFE